MATPTPTHCSPFPGVRRPSSPTHDDPPAPPRPSKTQSPANNRPPTSPPGSYFGPYLQFITTSIDPLTHLKVWHGSALTLHRCDSPFPTLKFDHELVHPDVPGGKGEREVLFQDIFGFTAVRWQLSFEIPDGLGDERIKWTYSTGGGEEGEGAFKEEGGWSIARWGQAWRGGFFSCGGFDGYVPEGVVKEFGFDSVWRHMNSLHESTPLHLMIYGGDQIYVDNIFEDIPFLKRWIEMPWDVKWKHEFSPDSAEYCASYSFFAYFETWERAECKKALRTCPALMTWDDHDIFDGAGSYPDELRTSPVMSGLWETAYTMRLLFQHHTTRELSNTKHGLFGYKAQNHIAQLGPLTALFMPDGRTERTSNQVHDPRSWDMVFDRLAGDGIADTTQHLLVAFAVPFSFIRVPAAEALFEFLKNRAPWVRKLPGLKGTNSIFGLPEFYDDLLDEWTHDRHIEERNSVLVKFQQFAAKRSIRVTYLSGDVHCAGFSRFRTDKKERQRLGLRPGTDPNLMYQAIASAIVNASPSPTACIGYHYVKNKWTPVANTEEATVEMFERRPEGGKHVRHRKFMPNRNWLYFEMVGTKDSGAGTKLGDTQYVVNDNADNDEDSERTRHHNTQAGSNADAEEHHHHAWHRSHKQDLTLLDFSRHHYAFDKKSGYPTTLGPTSNPEGTGCEGNPNHHHKHGMFCHHKKSKAFQKDVMQEKSKKIEDSEELKELVGVRLRIWLESRKKEEKGRQFSSYELVIPPLEMSRQGDGKGKKAT